MEFWDDVFKKVSDAANYTAKETGKFTEVAKLKFNLMREKTKLDDAYRALGETYYNTVKEGTSDEEALSLVFDLIEASKTEIERLETEINVLKNTVICSKCGFKVDKEMTYCPKCGEKLAKEEPAEETAEQDSDK